MSDADAHILKCRISACGRSFIADDTDDRICPTCARDVACAMARNIRSGNFKPIGEIAQDVAARLWVDEEPEDAA